MLGVRIFHNLNGSSQNFSHVIPNPIILVQVQDPPIPIMIPSININPLDRYDVALV